MTAVAVDLPTYILHCHLLSHRETDTILATKVLLQSWNPSASSSSLTVKTIVPLLRALEFHFIL